MRVIVHGVGAIGGTVAAGMTLGGVEVVGIARGAMLAAIADQGLRLRTPDRDERVVFPVVAHPSEIEFREDDIVLLCVKGQDTVVALEDLRRAGVRDQPIFCAQNGICNEREALRRFPNVHGVTVMMPAHYVDPGEVAVFSGPRLGVFDVGRYPHGADADDARIAEALEAGGLSAFVQHDVMASKTGKLLMNIGNVQVAAVGAGVDRGELGAAVRREAEAVLRAAGVTWVEVNETDPRRAELLVPRDVPGVTKQSGSTHQSLLRGAARVETDYLNGEITLLARLNGLEAPLNAALTRLGNRMADEGIAPGSYTLESLAAAIAAGG